MITIDITDLPKFNVAIQVLKLRGGGLDDIYMAAQVPITVNASPRTALAKRPPGSTVIAVESHGLSSATVFIFTNDEEITTASSTGFTQRKWYCSQRTPDELYELTLKLIKPNMGVTDGAMPAASSSSEQTPLLAASLWKNSEATDKPEEQAESKKTPADPNASCCGGLKCIII